MPISIIWTPAQDAAILRLRARGYSWDAIGEALQYPRSTVLTRGRAIGATKAPSITNAPDHQAIRLAAGKAPLPAFHPIAAAVLADAPPPAMCQPAPAMCQPTTPPNQPA